MTEDDEGDDDGVVAVAAGLMPFNVGESVNPGCGSVLIPEDRWSDCIADRNAFAVAGVLIGAWLGLTARTACL